MYNKTRRPYSKGRPNNRSGNKQQSSRRPGGKRKQPSFNPSQFINKNPAQLEIEAYLPTHSSFADFGLHPDLVSALEKIGITNPTAIQDQAIPHGMNHRDIIGLAETGTGKTAAFLLSSIHHALHDDNQQTLILAPTRELAIQIERELQRLTPGMRIYSTVCVGGTSIGPQIKNLNRKNHFVIGTPGRILDILNRQAWKPNKVNRIILDEADRMLDMGFIHDIRQIIQTTPKEREMMFFSATMTKPARTLADEFLRNPVSISVKKQDVTNSIEQDIIPHSADTKFDQLVKLLQGEDTSRVIVFGAMKHSVERLSIDLMQQNVKAVSIHGNKSHPQRQRALSMFKSGQASVLVATDVAARGIHVDNVSHVINYDLPNTFEDYVHRIGRTGRGDKSGKALTFVPHTSVTR